MSVTNIKKQIVEDDEGKTLYFFYELPDTSSWSNFSTQAKPFLNELPSIFDQMSTQAKELYKNGKQELDLIKAELTESKEQNQIKEIEIKKLNEDQKQIQKEKGSHSPFVTGF